MLSVGDYVYFTVNLVLGGIATIGAFFTLPLVFVSAGYAVNRMFRANKAVPARYSANGGRLDYSEHIL